MSNTPTAQPRGRKNRSLIVALAATFALVAGACSSDDETAEPAETEEAVETETETESEEPAEEEPAEAEAPSSDPIKIMITGTIQSLAFSIPSSTVGAELAVAEVNAAGGINGRPLELIQCNDEGNPNNAAECVQTAISEEVVALVGGFQLFEPIVVPLLEDAGLPHVSPTLQFAWDSPVMFPVAAGLTAFLGVGAAAVTGGCERPASIISAEAPPDLPAQIQAGVESQGGTVAGVFQPNNPDLSPQVEAAIAADADCIASAVGPQELPGLIGANAGRLPIIVPDGAAPQPLLDALGEGADGLRAISQFLLPGSGDANVLALQEASEAIAPGIALDQFWFTGYIGVNLIVEALQGVDEPSAAAVLEGMSTISGYDTGVGPVLDFSTPNPVEAFSSIYSTNVYTWTIEGGQYVLLEGEEIDVQPAVELLAAAG